LEGDDHLQFMTTDQPSLAYNIVMETISQP